jgi:hypothetical protein
MDVKLRSLDFEIVTPEGKQIHYLGPFEGIREAVKLDPMDSISYEINLTSSNVTFGETMEVPGELIAPYHFPPGDYIIRGVYISYQTLTMESANYFQGAMFSSFYEFTIKEGQITPN